MCKWKDCTPDSKSINHWLYYSIVAGILTYGLYECFLGWLQLLHVEHSRHILYPVTGTFFNPGPYCGFIAIIIPLALSIVLDPQSKLMYYLSVIYLMLSLSIIPVLMGRTGWIAMIVGSISVLHARGKIRLHRKYIPIVVIVTIVSVTMIIWLKPASALGRILLWNVGLRASLYHPWLGCGWHKVAGIIGEAQERYFQSHSDSIFASVAGAPEYPFNDFIQIAIAYGIPALLLFVTILGLSFVYCYRTKNYGFAGSILAFFIVCFSSYPLHCIEFWVLLSFLLISVVITYFRNSSILKFILIIGIVSCSTYHILILDNIKTNDDKWARMRFAYQYRLYDKDIQLLDSLYLNIGNRPDFLFDYGRALRESELYAQSTSVLQQGMEYSSDPMFLVLIGRNCQDRGLYAEAENWYIRAINRNPTRFYQRYLLAKLYASAVFFDSVRFRRQNDYIMNTVPKVSSPAIHQMREELARANDSINNLRQ